MLLSKFNALGDDWIEWNAEWNDEMKQLNIKRKREREWKKNLLCFVYS